MSAPQAIQHITIGVEDVPPPQAPWVVNQVPLAAAIEPSPGQTGTVVLYRRPIEHRAASSRGLRILVHRTLAEQLAALTGLSMDEIDPTGYGESDD